MLTSLSKAQDKYEKWYKKKGEWKKQVNRIAHVARMNYKLILNIYTTRANALHVFNRWVAFIGNCAMLYATMVQGDVFCELFAVAAYHPLIVCR